MFSRLRITGRLDLTTPYEVIELLCLCHDINVPDNPTENDIIHAIYKLNQEPEVDLSSFDNRCQVVNPNVKWDETSLKLSINHLQRWTKEQTIPDKIIPGDPTPENPESHDSCILFRLCCCHGIITNIHTTSSQMVMALSAKRDKIKFQLIQNISANLDKLSIEQLTSLLTLTKLQFKELPKPTKDSILQESVKYKSTIIPVNHEQAIIHVGKNLGIDITLSNQPLEEYYILSKVKKDNYHPHDHKFREIYELNYFSLSRYFNPMLPKSCYKDDVLISMAKNEGYDNNQILTEGCYELLQMAYLEYNMYLYHPRHRLTTTKCVVTLEETKDFYFGIYGGEMTPISTVGLVENFHHHQYFFNPITNSEFSERIINKISKHTNDKNLKGIISIIRAKNSTIEAKVRRFHNLVKSLSESDKSKIIFGLNKLLHLAMYMRGWSGNGPYPTGSCPVDNPFDVFSKVTAAVGEYFLAVKDHPADQIQKAYLLEYRDNEFKVNRKHGLERKIEDAIKKITEGKDDVNSCIRTNSNYLAYTSWYYLTIISQPPPFELQSLRYIA